MARYFAAILVAGQCVWADDRIEAPTAAAARAEAERLFTTPLPQAVIDAESPYVQNQLRILEATAAELRRRPRVIEVRKSRAKPRGIN